MAGTVKRLNRRDQEVIRSKINGDRLVAMIECFITGTEFDYGAAGGKQLIDWTPTQYKAAQNLLDKIVPNLKTSEVEMDEKEATKKVQDKPVADQQKEWAEKHSNVKTIKDAK